MARPGRNGTSRVAGRQVEVVLPGVLELLRTCARPRCKKYLLAGVMVWSPAVTPAAVLLGARGDAWGAIPMCLGMAGLFSATLPFGTWDRGSGVSLRERLTAASLFTAVVLLLAASFPAPYALHGAVGHSVRARVTEVWSTPLEGTDEEDPGRLSYRISDAVTEQDLGVLLYGLPERTPAGTVIEVSVVPGGWWPPLGAERLDDGTARLAVTVFRGVAAAHVLACTVAWFGWPRKDAR